VKLKLLVVSALTALCLLNSGCTHRLMDFTYISSKNFELNGDRGPRVTGSDCSHIVLFFPTGFPSVREAVDRAIESAGPQYNALEDGVVASFTFYIPLIYGKYCYDVEGTAVSTRGERKTLRSRHRTMTHSNVAAHADSKKQCQRFQRLCEQGGRDDASRMLCLKGLQRDSVCLSDDSPAQTADSLIR
jgi:hypothetical protein